MTKKSSHSVVCLGWTLLYVVVVAASWLNTGQTWIIREPAVLLFIAASLIYSGSRLRFPSVPEFLLLAYGLAAFVVGIAFDSQPLVALASSRFVVFYPFLVLVGYNLLGKISQKEILLPVFLFGVICAIGGFLETVSPSLFAVIMQGRFAARNPQLVRYGIGVGLGSVLGSRVDFGMILVLSVVVAPLFLRPRWLLGAFDGLCMLLVILTLSRTAIVTAAVVVSFYTAVAFSRPQTRQSLLAMMAAVTTVFICILGLSRTPLGLDVLESLSRSLGAMDLTLSGRTVIWATIFHGRSFFAPHLAAFTGGAFGVTGDGPITSDNAWIKYIVTLGLPVLIPLFPAVLVVCRRFRRMTRVGQLLLIMFLAYSVTVEFWYIAPVVVPSFLVIGLDYASAEVPLEKSFS